MSEKLKSETPEELLARHESRAAADAIPKAVTPAQLRSVLTDVQETQVNDLILSISDEAQRRQAEAYWNYATYFERANPLLVGLAASLQTIHGSGWTPEDVDNMFIAAVANAI